MPPGLIVFYANTRIQASAFTGEGSWICRYLERFHVGTEVRSGADHTEIAINHYTSRDSHQTDHPQDRRQRIDLGILGLDCRLTSDLGQLGTLQHLWTLDIFRHMAGYDGSRNCVDARPLETPDQFDWRVATVAVQ
jgi:hypothetical protein